MTFGVIGAEGRGRRHLQGLVVFGLGLALTSGALALLHASTAPGRAVELGVLTASLAATLLRFVQLQRWVFGRREVT